jgi:hypothetical protein
MTATAEHNRNDEGRRQQWGRASRKCAKHRVMLNCDDAPRLHNRGNLVVFLRRQQPAPDARLQVSVSYRFERLLSSLVKMKFSVHTE